MPQNLTNEKSILVRVMVCCRQAASHYLNQLWQSSDKKPEAKLAYIYIAISRHYATMSKLNLLVPGKSDTYVTYI